MVNKKKILIIVFIAIIVIAIIVIFVNRNKNEKIEVSVQSPSVIISDKEYDEETGLYYIKDEKTGEIIYASYDENDPDFEFYKEHPDYNPNPLAIRSTNLEDFIYYGEYEENYEISAE